MESITDTINFTTRLPAKLAEEAKKLAKRRAKSLNQLIAEAVKAELDRERDKLALEGYAYYAKEDAHETEEGFDE